MDVSAPLEIDGSRHSGSGAIVRQATAYAVLTGRPIHVTNARERRREPGLRRQHVAVIEALADLANASTTGVAVGAREFTFEPRARLVRDAYEWDIGSAGSTTMLAVAVLPVLAMGPRRVSVRVIGGLFQDFAPSAYHVQHALLPLLTRFGVRATLEMERPGYVPTGHGVIRLTVEPAAGPLRPVRAEGTAPVRRVWGIALASHLRERKVAVRMAESAKRVLETAGHVAEIETVDDDTALQRGAALALFADLEDGSRLGTDRAGAPGRPAERIGRQAARSLLDDIASGSVVDTHVADQLIPFAAMAAGQTVVRIPKVTDHVASAAWLAREFLGATVAPDVVLRILGRGLRPAV